MANPLNWGIGTLASDKAFASSIRRLSDGRWGERPFQRSLRISSSEDDRLDVWSSATKAGFWPHPIWQVGHIEDFSDVVRGDLGRCSAFVLIDEIPAWHAFGPNGQKIASLLASIASLDPSMMQRIPTLVAKPSGWGWRDVNDQRVLTAWRVGGLPDDTTTAMDHVHNAIRAASRERMDEIQPGAYWDDEYRQSHITDPAWASTAEAAARFAASIILASRLTPDAVADLAAPWQGFIGC